MKNFVRLLLTLLFFSSLRADIPVWWWEPYEVSNFGDALSKVVIEKLLGKRVRKAYEDEHKLLGVGSIIHFANEGDVVWGSGINGKHPQRRDYGFVDLDVRAVRGPHTREFLLSMGIKVPEIFGDPTLLLPLLFPEFKKNPKQEYLIIPHISEMQYFKKNRFIAFPTEPWKKIVEKILESEFVIASSLHGIIVAEAFGIPACLLRITENEPLFKYEDYYLGTGRETFNIAHTIDEALKIGGSELPVCDLQALIDAFPYELFD